jgi:hypothetical protein
MVGRVSAMATSIAASPIIARLFLPEDYGIADVTQSGVIVSSRIAWRVAAGLAAFGLIVGHRLGVMFGIAVAYFSSRT